MKIKGDIFSWLVLIGVVVVIITFPPLLLIAGVYVALYKGVEITRHLKAHWRKYTASVFIISVVLIITNPSLSDFEKYTNSKYYYRYSIKQLDINYLLFSLYKTSNIYTNNESLSDSIDKYGDRIIRNDRWYKMRTSDIYVGILGHFFDKKMYVIDTVMQIPPQDEDNHDNKKHMDSLSTPSINKK